MIITTLNKLRSYTFIPFLLEIGSFLANHDITKIVEGDYEIRGKNLFYRVLRYTPKVPAEVKLETHSVYTDVQILLEGMEIIPVALTENLISLGDYNPVQDIQFFKTNTYMAEILFQPQMLAVFFPGESHASKQYQDHIASVRKIVFKVQHV